MKNTHDPGPGGDVVIRSAEPADLAGVTALDRASFPWDSPDLERALGGELERGIEHGDVWLLERGEDLIGYVHADRSQPGVVYIAAMAVHPAIRGKGFGQQLATHCLQWFDQWSQRARDLALVTVTSPSNLAMVRLLISADFGGRWYLTDHFGPEKDRVGFQYRRSVPPPATKQFLARISDRELLARLLGEEQMVIRRLSEIDGEPAFVLEPASAEEFGACEPPKAHLPHGVSPLHNADVRWEDFDPALYWNKNYKTLRSDDRIIIRKVGRFFSRHFAHLGLTSPLAGLDVGTGSNLYPALGMLPWCSSILLTDMSSANIRWLNDSMTPTPGPAPETEPEWDWMPFWRAFEYGPVTGVRTLLRERSVIRRQSVFTLPANEYDIGTMFFVAESMTSYEQEFEDALVHFLRALKPGAPFAAAFMDRSTGYAVGTGFFPAVKQVNADLVRQVLARFGGTSEVVNIDIPPVDGPLREGYEGMILALGVTPEANSC